ncbi:hypothetical protein D3C75_1320860 [compost metagenome]
MAEHLLNRTEICTAFQQVCCERMPQGMRSDFLLDLSFARIFFDDFPEALTGQPAAETVQK